MPVKTLQERRCDVVYPPIDRPVRVTGRSDGVKAFLAAMDSTLKGWPHRPSTGRTPFCTVHATAAGRYTISSDYLSSPLEDLPLASAVCAALADISEAYIAAHDDMRALHCGAVGMGGRMVLLSGQGHAGKSTLVARLGHEQGIVIYCDDVLPIRSDGMAVALGVPPRLRLPLPASAHAGFRQYVQSRTRLRDDACAYHTSPATAPHGTQARPEVLLLLKRAPGAAPAFHALSPDMAASAMLAQDMSLQADGLAHIDRVAAMARTMICATFVYDDLEEATQMLVGLFGASSLNDLKMGPPLPFHATAHRPQSPVDLSAAWRRNSMTGLRNHEGAAFLWAPVSGRYYHLNPVALACWHLIESPITGTELASNLCEVFPDVPAERIRADVAAWLAEMSSNGLVEQT